MKAETVQTELQTLKSPPDVNSFPSPIGDVFLWTKNLLEYEFKWSIILVFHRLEVQKINKIKRTEHCRNRPPKVSILELACY